MDHRHPYAALACPPSHRRDGSSLSRPFQVVSGADRCAFPDGRALCGAQCAAGEAGPPSRRLAVVKHLATGAGRSQADGVAQCLARGAATGLGDPRESPPDPVGAGGAPGERTTGTALRRRRLGAANGATVWDGIYVAIPRTTERIVRKDSRPLFFPFSFLFVR